MHNHETIESTLDDGTVTQVIRPAAVVPEEAARDILVELSLNNVQTGGLWLSEPSRWSRYDRAWQHRDDPGEAGLIGTIQIAYGTPTKYEITIYRVTITKLGSDQGWTVRALSDEALGYGGLSLAQCPRATMSTPPKPYRF